MANTSLNRTNVSPSGSGYKYTFSAWIKRSKFESRQMFWRVLNPSATTYYAYMEFQADDRLHINDGTSAGTLDIVTKASFRDTNAWYHIMGVVDTTQGTAADRVKLYVNGSEITELAGTPTLTLGQNQATSGTASGKTTYVGGDPANNTRFFDGSMAHVHFVDGQAYAPSVFGETDSATGEWKPKPSPGISTSDYGNNGFFLKFENSSAMGTDSSGNSHTLAVGGGTVSQRKDTPDNIFATLNPLDNTGQTLSHGNTSGYGTTSKTYRATLGFKGSGKYYWECKCVTQNTYTMIVGLANEECFINDSYASSNVGTNVNGWSYFMQNNSDNGKSFHGNNLSSVYQTVSQGDILQIAVDASAGKIWWGVNGTWVNSGDPANGNNAIYTNVSTDQYLFPAYSVYAGSGGTPLVSFNFGDGLFGTTAVSSAGTNASEIGVFEYNVPTGFTALSTKGLNT